MAEPRAAILTFVVVFILVSSHCIQSQSTLRRVCYYTNWSQYRPGIGRFVPENVDPNLCTHYVYAFATLDGAQIKSFEWNDESTEWSQGMFERFQALKLQNPLMKTLLAVGGWNIASGPFSSMVATVQTRETFAFSVVAFLRKFRFDGLDMDWEYPANRGSQPEDKDRFTELIKDLRRAFDQESFRTGNPRLLLTAAVAGGKYTIDTAYDVPSIVQYLDFLSVMGYDLHGSWETYTGHHSALFARAGETGNDTYLNVDFAVNYWVQKGAPKEKINIGVSFYGRTFTLASTTQTHLGAPVKGAGSPGPETREAGFLAYYEICRMQQNGAQVYNDVQQHVPFISLNDQWVGYENQHSLAEKACYAKQNGFGGVMVWAIDLDDFTGQTCGQGVYPLLNAIKKELNNPSTSNCPTPSSFTYPTGEVFTLKPPDSLPTQHVPVQHTTSGPVFIEDPRFSCVNLFPGFHPNPNACDEYYVCANSMSFRVKCNPGLYFNPQTNACDENSFIYCLNNQAPAILPTVTTHAHPFTTSTQSGLNFADKLCALMPDGIYRHPYDCNKYIQCQYHAGLENSCLAGYVYSEIIQSCQHPYMVAECEHYVDSHVAGK